MVVGAILMVAAAVAAWAYVICMPEKEPQEKKIGTGVVEQVYTKDGATRYVIRFTGEKNRSYLAKTPGYNGNTAKYEDGKLVRINYWFGKKAPGVEILDQELTAAPEKRKGLPLLIASALLLIAGVICMIVL